MIPIKCFLRGEFYDCTQFIYQYSNEWGKVRKYCGFLKLMIEGDSQVGFCKDVFCRAVGKFFILGYWVKMSAIKEKLYWLKCPKIVPKNEICTRK